VVRVSKMVRGKRLVVPFRKMAVQESATKREIAKHFLKNATQSMDPAGLARLPAGQVVAQKTCTPC